MKHLKISAFLFAAIVAVGVFAVLAVCMARADARPPNRDMDLYLLIGQSNMAGRGALTEANCISTERVFKLGKSGNWEEATEPIHFDKPSAGAGLAASFARTMADRDPSVKIGLVPCAVGGSHMNTWVKGGVNYSNAVVRLRKALESGVLKGILWHQGEGDASDAAETAAWAEKFAGMIADLRSEFGDVPVVAGELGRYLDDYTRKTMNWRAINSQLHGLEGRIPCFAVVSSEGLTANGDNLHLDTKSLRVFGTRYASAMLAAGRPAVKTGPNRNATALQVSLKKIGCLRPKSVREVGPSNFTIDGAPVDRDFVDFDKYRDYLEPLGVNKIRILTGWAKSERERGKIDVAWLDHIVDWCLAHGIEPLLELSYGNPIYPGAGGAGLSDGIPNTPEGLEAWDRWVDFLGGHFKGRVNEWAMWNEPDNRITVNTPDKIAAFNVRSAKILRRHMPECRLHGLSLAWSTAERLESCIKPMGEDARLFDTFVYHGYIANPDRSYEDDRLRKDVVAKYAPGARLRQGENGAPSEFGAAFALRFIPWSETSQAKYDLRRALGDLGHDLESGLFCIVDINYRPPTFPTFFCNRKGYLRLNAHNDVIQVKRAYYAIQNMVSVFNANLTRVKEPRVSSTDPSLSLFEYVTRAGEPLFVFWEHGRMICERHPDRKTEYNAKIDPASGVPSDSFTTREVVFEWRGQPFKEPVWCDLMTGWVYEIPQENQIVHADGITFVRIPAYDSPCFVAERRALELE